MSVSFHPIQKNQKKKNHHSFTHRDFISPRILIPYLAGPAGLGLDLGVKEDMGLLLESTLRLNSQFRGHDCDFCWSRSQEGRGIGIAVVTVVGRSGVFWWLEGPGDGGGFPSFL